GRPGGSDYLRMQIGRQGGPQGVRAGGSQRCVRGLGAVAVGEAENFPAETGVRPHLRLDPEEIGVAGQVGFDRAAADGKVRDEKAGGIGDPVTAHRIGAGGPLLPHLARRTVRGRAAGGKTVDAWNAPYLLLADVFQLVGQKPSARGGTEVVL